MTTWFRYFLIETLHSQGIPDCVKLTNKINHQRVLVSLGQAVCHDAQTGCLRGDIYQARPRMKLVLSGEGWAVLFVTVM